MLSRYLPDEQLAFATLRRNSSSQWGNIFKVRNIFNQGYRWVLGEGQVSFLKDNWLGQGPIRSLLNDEEWEGRCQCNSKGCHHGRWLLGLATTSNGSPYSSFIPNTSQQSSH